MANITTLGRLRESARTIYGSAVQLYHNRNFALILMLLSVFRLDNPLARKLEFISNIYRISNLTAPLDSY